MESNALEVVIPLYIIHEKADEDDTSHQLGSNVYTNCIFVRDCDYGTDEKYEELAKKKLTNIELDQLWAKKSCWDFWGGVARQCASEYRSISGPKFSGKWDAIVLTVKYHKQVSLNYLNSIVDIGVQMFQYVLTEYGKNIEAPRIYTVVVNKCN
jgi:hypothetical protein